MANKDIYIPDDDLVAAAQVALTLDQPLLLTGEPGTGKTTFAQYVANHLAPAFHAGGEARDLPPYPLYTFETKSTSAASDLFYRFDSLRRLHAAYDKEMSNAAIDYVTFEALGRSIIETLAWSEVNDLVHQKEQHSGPRRSVVLIDEIDKAPRDFPNDLLSEIEQKYFKIHELPAKDKKGVRVVSADLALSPIIILTSNSEKNLPAPFLRRCVFHHIRFPDQARLESIILSNKDELSKSLTRSAIEFFGKIRAKLQLDKSPTTSELIQWVNLLHRQGGAQHIQDLSDVAFRRTLGVLGKTAHDLEKIEKFAAEELERAVNL